MRTAATSLILSLLTLAIAAPALEAAKKKLAAQP
jgi:hypothetical protein